MTIFNLLSIILDNKRIRGKNGCFILSKEIFNLKNNLIPSTQNRIKELGREIFQAEATLNAISDEKYFLRTLNGIFAQEDLLFLI